MASRLALQSFRASTALFSSRNLSHPSRHAVARYYSDKPAEDESKADADPPHSNGGAQENGGEVTLTPEQEKLKEKEAQVVDLTGRLRYLQADFLNLQRNAAREKEQTKDFAITRFATDLLETADVLALALKSIPKSAIEPSATPTDTPPEKSPQQYLQELYSGVEITQRQLVQTLFKYNVKPFDPTGDNFDPNRHEALYQAPIPGKEPGTVIDCQKIGYMIKDRVLRAAQVGVAQDTS